MKRRFTFINILLTVTFFSSTILVFPAFSYGNSAYNTPYTKSEKVDESQGYKPERYKKVRCPRCGMEFFYIPQKEGPHAHWVNYEIPEEKSVGTSSEKRDKRYKETKRKRPQEKEKFSDLFEKNKVLLEQKSAQIPTEKNISFPQRETSRAKKYELRLRLTCPYDGYSFFPEGDVIEDRKLMQQALFKEPSVIESSFTKSIPFGISKDLRQFGYDLFRGSKEGKKSVEAKSGLSAKTGEALSALGMLKEAFTSGATHPSFSSETKTASQSSAVVPISPDYIIGPGDTLVINIWGSVQESFPVNVDREGKIMLPKAGPLYLWGLKFQEAENRIRNRLNQFYTNFNVDVSMGKLRKIQVYIIGEVRRPGSYSMDSHSTIFQALYDAGGVTKLGSLRKVKLLHKDGKKEEIDLYPFLLQGESIDYSRIQSGDTIFVPTIGDVVAIAGNVKRPAIYETKSEILLSDLVNFGGGITPIGDLQRIQIERITDNAQRKILDVELRRANSGQYSFNDTKLRNGDLVIVLPIVRLRHNFVSILGNVERPGDYALTDDMKVKDLIQSAKGFLPGTYLYRAEISRVTKDRTRETIPVNLERMLIGEKKENAILKEWDILIIYSEADVQPPSFVEIEGAVNIPGKYELTPEMKISDLIFKAGGVKPNKVIRGGELFHIMPGEEPLIFEIGIRRISQTTVSIDKDIILRAGDAVFIKSEPKLTERKLITITGEVRYPGRYSIREGERLSSIIERAGGFTKNAFLEGAFFTRKSIKEMQEKMREKFLEKENRSLLEEQQAILLRGSSSGIVSAAPTTESLDMRKKMLDYIKSVEIKGRMVIKLLPLSQLKTTKYDILLEDGDMLKIPQTPSAVAVMGSVNNPVSIPFEQGKGIEYYLRKSGGLTRHADKNGIYVIHANGEAEGKFIMSKNVGLGDTIVVPQRFKYYKGPYDILKETVDILSRIAIGVGVIAALN